MTLTTLSAFAPGQPPDTALFVPIDVQAVAVGADAAAGQVSVPTETVLPIVPPNAPEATALPRPPQPFAPASPRPPGVYLHWAMPDALTRGDAGAAREGTVGAGNPLQLPALPDRWAVIRLPHLADTAEGFLVEADRARHFRLTDWFEPDPLPSDTLVTDGKWFYPGARLTATSGGDVAWAATYDAVVDRFGFYDPLVGVDPTKTLSYLVIGWWSRAGLDPLAGLTRVAHYFSRLVRLGWGGPAPIDLVNGGPVQKPPTRSLLHGMVSGVPASGVGTDARPDPTLLEIGLGGTGYAALAAQLGEGTDEERAASERLLSAFASGLLDRIDEPDGLVAVDEDRHTSAFVAISDGTEGTDRIAEGDRFATPDSSGTTPTDNPLRFRDVPSARPRYFVPGDLAVVVHGAHRSLRHGEDNRLTFNGLLPCRLSHDLILEVGGGVLTEAGLPPALRQLPSDNIPVEIHWLLRESVLLDPLRIRDRRRWAKGANTDPTPPRGHRWIIRWNQAWVPLWVDWELGLRLDADLRRWRLGPTDLEADGLPDGGAEVVVQGRALLESAAGTAFGAQVRAWLAEEDRRDLAGQGQVSEADERVLEAAASAAEGRDLLSGSLRGVRERLLGLDPQRALFTRIKDDGTPSDKPPALAQPQVLAGGAAAVRRLRIVDAFGRFVDVPGSVLGALEVAATHRHPAGAPRFTLAPRFQRPARLALRLVDPRPPDDTPPVEARVDQEHPELAVSPVAGWLLPDHVDEALECFDTTGRPLGQLMHDPLTSSVVFEVAPGQPGSIGGPPGVPDPGTRHVMAFAEGMIAADVAARTRLGGPPEETALSALLRGIDTTLWTSDPLGSLGTASVAGLVGRPLAVVRATLSLDVLSDVDELAYGRTPSRADRQRAYAELAARAVAVRLGELTRTNDGLMAYFVDDDYRQVRLVAPEVAQQARASGARRGVLARVPGLDAGSTAPPAILPIDNPYISGRSEVSVRPGQTVRLTLLLHPGGQVHVTSGVVPRKGLGLARDWFHETLDRLSPSFRVGPVLVDPAGIRMPRVTGLGDRQTFTRRDTPLTWRDDPILAASQTALLPDAAAGLQEGWIRVLPEQPAAPGSTS